MGIEDIKNNLPLVSIISPCRNEEKFIGFSAEGMTIGSSI
jgi:cellulose synthase/poly-beta-1,6-N-acetylglucosamine synthase-like glycosyltransferase